MLQFDVIPADINEDSKRNFTPQVTFTIVCRGEGGGQSRLLAHMII